MDYLDKILYNLQTLANIPRGAKLITGREFIDIDKEEGLRQSLLRAWRCESRERNIADVRGLIEVSVLVSDLLIESRNRTERADSLRTIAMRLYESKAGIVNLCNTYNDANISGQLEPLLWLIDEQVQKIAQALSRP